MPITTYSGLTTEIMRLIDGEDVSGSEIPAQTLTTIIHFGELRIYREVRSRHNEKAWPATPASNNLIALPSDFVASSVAHFGKKPLTPKSENELLEKLYVDQGGSDCESYCNAGSNFMFYPAIADGAMLQGRYYHRYPDLDETTFAANELVNAHDDLFIYAALSVSAPYFGQDSRLPMWNAEYRRIADEISVLDHRSAYSSGRMVRGNNMRNVA